MKTLPPDPDDMNDMRAFYARCALDAFMQQTEQTDEEEAIRDLLTNLRHLVDRIDMPDHVRDQLFERAEENYREETSE